VKIINITFHGIGSPPDDAKPDERDVWLRIEKFEAILNVIQEHENIHITVDDGNRSDVDIILPALMKRGLKASFFLLVSAIDQTGYISKEGVRRLAMEGMTIGSHGLAHRDWRKLNDEELTIEVLDSKNELERMLDQSICEVSCPFGSYDRRVLRFLRNAGYQRVCTSDRGLASAEAWLQPRNSLHAWDEQYSVQHILSKGFFAPDFLMCRFKTAVKRLR
jgi:peptidoglycan/xylan/chitin deacetylase (PgdA/CDA1 family)